MLKRSMTAFFAMLANKFSCIPFQEGFSFSVMAEHSVCKEGFKRGFVLVKVICVVCVALLLFFTWDAREVINGIQY